MDVAGLELTTRDAAALRGRLARAAGDAPTSPPQDLLCRPEEPVAAGWHRLERRRTVPGGDLQAVREELLTWGVLRAVGIAPVVDTTRVGVGSTVLQRLPRRGPAILAPCRVVAVLDTDDEAGFLYAALPGHPFTGEEAFAARRVDGGVEVRVTSRSRAAEGATAARVLLPALRAGQRGAARGYCAAMADAAAPR